MWTATPPRMGTGKFMSCHLIIIYPTFFERWRELLLWLSIAMLVVGSLVFYRFRMFLAEQEAIKKQQRRKARQTSSDDASD